MQFHLIDHPVQAKRELRLPYPDMIGIGKVDPCTLHQAVDIVEDHPSQSDTSAAAGFERPLPGRLRFNDKTPFQQAGLYVESLGHGSVLEPYPLVTGSQVHGRISVAARHSRVDEIRVQHVLVI